MNQPTRMTDRDLPLQRLHEWARRQPDRVFLTQPTGGGKVHEYTWAQTLDECRRIAAFLRSRDFPEGSRIAIMSRNCAHWLMADFAVWMAGHVSVPLYPSLGTESVRRILVHSEALAVFVGKLDDWESMTAGIPSETLRIAFPMAPQRESMSWDQIIKDTPPLSGHPLRAAEDLATVIYTSGTTGEPKGVMHSFRNLGHCAALLEQVNQANAEDRVLSYLPLAHAAERTAVEMLAIRTGMRVYFNESLETFVDDLKRAQPTLFLSVPRLWVKFQQGATAKIPERRLRRLLRIPLLGGAIRRKILRGLGLDHVRIAGSGAAPLPEAVMQWYRALGLELLEGYGMTELCGLSHMCRPGAVRVGFVGEALEGVRVRIADDGEVQVATPVATQGYFRNPEQTTELFTSDGFVRTGDRGEIDVRGRLRITGRIKDLFKTSKGKYVAPAPIENRLTEHEAVEACCVIGAGYPQPCALLMLSDPCDVGRPDLARSLESLRERVNASLDDHEKLGFLAIVKAKWSVENGFLTPTLKVRRNRVDEHYAPQLPRWYGSRENVLFE